MPTPTLLTCPVCSAPLRMHERHADCPNGHLFNRAKEGYLNLLRSSKSGDATGDPKAAARSRRDFLNQGYYQPLRDALVGLVTQAVGDAPTASGSAGDAPALLDICCGEGYYTSALGGGAGGGADNQGGGADGVDVYGFDLSKEMVRLAAKRGGATYFVANLKAIPVADGSFDLATHLFAPFNEAEFARVLKPGGTLLSVVPGARHLWGLKQAVYETPYLNDEKLPAVRAFELVGTHRVETSIELRSNADIQAVFQMTPYYYRTRPDDRAKLDGLDQLATPIEFVIAEYRKAR